MEEEREDKADRWMKRLRCKSRGDGHRQYREKAERSIYLL